MKKALVLVLKTDTAQDAMRNAGTDFHPAVLLCFPARTAGLAAPHLAVSMALRKFARG